MHGLQHCAHWARCLAVGGLATLLIGSPSFASGNGDRRIATRIDHPISFVSSEGLQAERWEVHHPGATFIKLHFSAFMVPDGVTVEIASPDGSERYVYSRRHKDALTWDASLGDDGRTRFSAMSISGDTAVVRIFGQLNRLRPDLHRVQLDHYLSGFQRDEAPVPPSTLERALDGSTSKPELTCGINERYDAVCWKGSHLAEYETAHAVAVLVTATGVECTAWRVGPDNHLFTAQHCVGDQDDVTGAEIWFNYQAKSCGGSSTSTPVKVTGGQFLAGDATLDFGLFTVNDFQDIAGFGYLGLEVRDGMLGEGIFIPQHGLGRPSQISLESDMNASGYCEIDDVSKNGYGKDTDIGYYCDTTTSSSGSPVITADSGKVIGLHHLGGCLNSASKMKLIWPKVSNHFGGKVPNGDSTWTGGDWAEQTGANQSPEAWFTFACEGLACDFDASGSEDADGAIMDWNWSMGDRASLSGVAVTHSFAEAGTYTVQLTVIDDAGAEDVLSETVTVEAQNTPPSANFSFSCDATECHFNAGSSADPDGSISSYEWTLGDGTSVSGGSVVHTYDAAGSYAVKLTVTDDEGATASKTRSVSVTLPNQSPAANFTYSCDDLSCVFDGSSSTDPDGSVSSWSWSFGDGDSGQGGTVSHAFSAGGSYVVKLTVTDDDGAGHSLQKTVQVQLPTEEPPADEPPAEEPPAEEPPAEEPPAEQPSNQAPFASFTFSCEANGCAFDAVSSRDVEGPIEHYQWDFGDGATDSGMRSSHEYKGAGSYTVTLTVTDVDGATHSTTRLVEVAARKPIELQVDGNNFNGKVLAVLKWSGAESQNVDIYRDGKLLASTKNNGVHIDKALLKRAKNMRYRLCEQGSSNCSGEVGFK